MHRPIEIPVVLGLSAVLLGSLIWGLLPHQWWIQLLVSVIGCSVLVALFAVMVTLERRTGSSGEHPATDQAATMMSTTRVPRRGDRGVVTSTLARQCARAILGCSRRNGANGSPSSSRA